MKIRLIKCEFCKAMFQDTSSLVHHMNTHIKNDIDISDAELDASNILNTTGTTKTVSTRTYSIDVASSSYEQEEISVLCNSEKKKSEDSEINTNPVIKDMQELENMNPVSDRLADVDCPVVIRRTSPRKKRPIIPYPLIEDDLQIAYASGMIIDLTCIPCNKTFKRRSHLSRHLKIHARVAEVICKFCKRNFDDQSMLAEHVLEQHQGSRAYQCSFCDKTFKRSSHLMRHRRIHTGVRPYKCSKCQQRFTDKTSLNSHFVTHASIKGHRCEICDKSFTRNSHLIRHMKSHNRNEGSQLAECKYCRLLFPNQEKLKSHVTSHSKTCHVCEKTFRNLSRLTRHISRHTRELAYKCHICFKVFSDNRDLETHVNTHSESKTYKCSFCPKTFSCQLYCDAHEKVHTGRQPFACQFCQRRFSTSSTLTEHLRCHSGPQLYACTQCPETFDHIDDLNEHSSTIHDEDEKPYKCDLCDRSFLLATTLASHVQTHVEKKLFECQYCQKRFLTRADQNRHLRLHANEIVATLHFCQVCQIEKNKRVTFPTREALNTHMTELHLNEPTQAIDIENNNDKGFDDPIALESGLNETVSLGLEDEKSTMEQIILPTDKSDTSLECLICHRQFTRANNLSIHLRCHTGERPYSCTMCDRKFALSGTLRRHMRTHSGEKPFKCQICLREFGAAYSLKRHLHIHANQWESGAEAEMIQIDEYEEVDKEEVKTDEEDHNDKNNNNDEKQGKLTIKIINKEKIIK